MNRRKYFSIIMSLVLGFTLISNNAMPEAIASTPPPPEDNDGLVILEERPDAQDIQDAAKRSREQGILPGVAGLNQTERAAFELDPGGIPRYFGPFANYANSPLPKGSIESITVDAQGSGYSSPVISVLDVYGTGVGAVATATLTSGRITAITVVDPGSGYSAPIIDIQDATGSGASATANLLPDTQSGIRKFIDKLPGLGPENANLLGQYIPIAVPDTVSFPGSDYYEIEIIEYSEQMHSDLPPTLLRGYRQTNGPDPDIEPHYFGPMIMATKDRPVRITFTNNLGTGEDGKLFIPVDTTIMGAGPGPLDRVNLGVDCNYMMGGDCEYYTENRTTVHLHGAFVPWISDGTPHQWFTPEGEVTQYTEGASFENVPDMWFDPSGNIIPNTTGQSTPPNPDALKSFPGKMTYFYNNEELGARLQFAHDHAWGITRLNVYVGMANGYLITDEYDQDLINGTNNTGINPNLISVFPDLGIPLVIQDKTFVDETTIAAQDPTWRWGSDAFDPNNPGAFSAHTGDLWMPSVYMPIQDPYIEGGISDFGRWHYGPWFWPPTTNIEHPPVPNEYSCDVSPEPCDIEVLRPNTPSPSMGMETFFDTTTVNGTVYPYLEVDPEVVRFRILNIANDRFLNLQFFVADPDVITADGRTNTEVKMVPADPNPEFPELWPTDGREGGVPDPKTAGPSWIQIGTEGGFLPDPVVIPPQPMTFITDAGLFNVGNVKDHSLLLGTAERADVLVDFSQYAGQTLILYNDSTAPFPAYDPRYDYYTGNPDMTSSGGAPTTQPGYGPNTRTIMQIRVNAAGEVPDSSVVSVDVLNPGSGYSTMPTVGFFGGGGTGAAAVATGSVDRIVPTNGASEFLTEAPIVTLVGGGGSGATAVANLVNGQIASYTVTNSGSGYTSAPTVLLTLTSDFPFNTYFPLFVGSGIGNDPESPYGSAIATLKISNIEVTAGGSGYSSAPNVSLLYGGGSGATARANLTAGPAYDMAPLEYIFAKEGSKPGLFEASQNRIIVPQAAYNTAYEEDMPGDYRAYVQISDNSISFFNGPLTGLNLTQGGSGYTSPPTVTITGGGGTGATATAILTGDAVSELTLDNPGDGYVSEPTVTLTGGGGSGAQAKAIGLSYDLEQKAIQDEMGEAFDEYGRMSGFLGLEMPAGAPGGQNFILYGYSSPPVDLLKDSGLTMLGELGDGTQIWKITHNGVDTHTIHIHLVNAQLINRVAWDGGLLPPEPNELGWKETFRVNPLEQTIFAMRPHAPTTQPFEVPNSVRLLDPSLPAGAMLMPPPFGQFQTPDQIGVTIHNEVVNYGWEYVWHCHLLSHEEMDMMHPFSLAVLPKPPIDLAAENIGGDVNLTWTDNTVSETNYLILRRVAPDSVWEMLDQLPMEAGSGSPMSYLDITADPATTYDYQIIAINVTGLVGLLPPDNISSMPNMEAQSEPVEIQITTP